MAGGSRGTKGKPSKAGKKAMQNNLEFRRIFDQVEATMNDRRRSTASQHPKLETARDLVCRQKDKATGKADHTGLQLVQHLAASECDEKELGKRTPTRCMVFCSFRGCVGEIVVSTWSARSDLHSEIVNVIWTADAQ